MGQLVGKRALVTGGASGIGLAAATLFAAEGAEVVVVDVNHAAGEAAAGRMGGRFIRANVGDPGDWERVVADLDGLDVAYLNAGVTTGESDITKLTDAQYRRVLSANVDGVVFGARAVVPLLEGSGGGAIVVTASLAGLIAFAADPIYTLTKHAVVGFVRTAAVQLQAKGITVNAVNPGIVDTPLVGDARQLLKTAGFPLIDPADVALQVLRCATGTATGECWVCLPNRPPEPYQFAPVPHLDTVGPLPGR